MKFHYTKITEVNLYLNKINLNKSSSNNYQAAVFKVWLIFNYFTESMNKVYF